MNINDIMNLWEQDSEIDETNIVNESKKIPKLHSKYYNILILEKLLLNKKQFELNQYTILKYEYYNGELDKETLKEHGFKPYEKKLLKSEIQKYLDGDKEIIELNQKISIQKEKVTFLKDIINTINQRTFILKNILEARKFENGIS